MESQIRKTDRMLLQIESVRKTEAGYYCEFSDPTGHIYGTLNKKALLFGHNV